MNRCIRSFAYVMVATALSCAQAKADLVLIDDNAGWTVSFDTEAANCVAKPKASEGIFYIQSSRSDLILLFAGSKMSWVRAERQYPTVVRTDARRWNGTLTGFKTNSTAGLALANPAGEFLRAIRGASKISIEADGATYGPYSLAGSNQTMSRLDECIKKRDQGVFKPKPAIAIEPNRIFEWSMEDVGKSFTIAEFEAKLQRQENLDDTASVYLRVSRKGRELGVLKAEGRPGGGSGQLGAYRLTEDGYSVVLSSYTGGAHCCMATVIGTASDYGMRTIDAGQTDGDGVSIRDIDLDGRYELVSVDQRFLYGFGPYAESRPPITIRQLNGVELVNVTRRPEFSSYLRKSLIGDLNRLVNGGDDIADGQVAGLLASAANVGMYSSVAGALGESALKKKPNDMAARCGEPECLPERVFPTLEEAIDFRFPRWGYETGKTMTAETLQGFRELAATPGFGSPTDGMETACSSIPYKFEVSDKGAVSMRGYEMSCDFEQAQQIGPSLLAVGLCGGEGEFWTSTYLIQRQGEELRLSNWDRDPSEIIGSYDPKDVLKQCPL